MSHVPSCSVAMHQITEWLMVVKTEPQRLQQDSHHRQAAQSDILQSSRHRPSLELLKLGIVVCWKSKIWGFGRCSLHTFYSTNNIRINVLLNYAFDIDI